MLKKTLLGSLVVVSLYAGEFEYGNGTFDIQGGFVGLTEKTDADVATYSLVEQHKNLFSSKWFYTYNFTWYDSDDMVAGQNSINSSVNTINTTTNTTILPSIDYRLQGLDINLAIGKDIYHKSENDFFGIGLMLGVSIPWIDSQKDDDNNDDTSDDAQDAMEKSKTEITTFKIGPTIAYRYGFNKYLSLYANATYAYQMGKVKNDYANTDSNVDGSFYDYGFGIRFTPFSYDKEMKYYNLKARLYFTAGYRYSHWTLKDLSIDVTGTGLEVQNSDLKMNSSIVYLGVGYSF